MHKNYKEHVISVCKLHTGTFKSGDTALLSDFIVFLQLMSLCFRMSLSFSKNVSWFGCIN